MTEYWVSQGNKWCDFCKIFISSNPTSIRNHELGQRHKDAVSQRLNNMRQEKAAKDKQDKEASRDFQQIEANAQRSYEKDIANAREVKDSTPTIPGDWDFDSSTGYYYNQINGCYYDTKSGFYYTDSLGRWVTQEEALVAVEVPSETMQKIPLLKKPLVSVVGSASESKVSSSSQSRPVPGPGVSTKLNPARSVKGAPSSIAVNKRKRQEGKPKAISQEEASALKAREEARKRVQEREKPLFGLYKH